MIIDKAIPHYTKTLVQMAASNGKLEAWLEALERLIHVLNQIPTVEKMLYHPFIRSEEKKKNLKALLKDQIDDQLLAFLFFLIEKKKTKSLRKIIESYRVVVNQRLGILDAFITSTFPLNEEEIDKIKLKLENAFQKKVIIKNQIDPQIIGGLIITIANEILDDSIKTRLLKLEEKLLEVNV
jgi:F-type H+-transporting ATPase subunit delta